MTKRQRGAAGKGIVRDLAGLVIWQSLARLGISVTTAQQQEQRTLRKGVLGGYCRQMVPGPVPFFSSTPVSPRGPFSADTAATTPSCSTQRCAFKDVHHHELLPALCTLCRVSKVPPYPTRSLSHLPGGVVRAEL